MASTDNVSIQYCNTAQCKICRLQRLDEDPNFHSSLAYNQYKKNNNGSCNTRNCIYLISCSAENCHLKYIGFTTTMLNKRLAGHRANILSGTEGCIMLEHFTKFHNICDMIIKPIDVCDGKVLRDREKFWMQELNSIYPYGLNSRIDIQGIHDAHEHVKKGEVIYKTFNTVKNNRTKRGSGVNRRGNTDQDPNLIIFDPQAFINSCTINEVHSINKHCRMLLMNLKIPDVRKLVIHVSKLLNSELVKYNYNQFLLFVIRDLCLYRLTIKQKEKSRKSLKYIMITHVNGLIEEINMNKIIKSKDSLDKFPGDKEYILNTGTSYKYSKTIRNKVTNYSNVAKNVDLPAQCKCMDYFQYIDIHHGHVITGNINIIDNIEIRQLLHKGLNFREKQPHNLKKAQASVQSGIDKFIGDCSVTLKFNLKMFSPWKKFILQKVRDDLAKKNNTHSTYKVLDQAENKNFLQHFHEHFVIVPVDKAAKNIGIICKYFYIQILKKEVQDSGNFVITSETTNSIISRYDNLLKRYNCNVLTNKKLPFIYWIPKFHKNPVDFRYITSGRDTIVHKLSNIVGTGLKSMLKLEKTNRRHLHKFDEIKDFYVIDDNQEVIKYMIIENIMGNKPKTIKTYDFKSLYGNIPHNKLKYNVTQFITSIFQLKGKKYLNITCKSATFSDRKGTSISFTQQDFISITNFLINNCFILHDKKVCKEVVGIPTGTNCAADLANIFLHVFEKSNVQKLVEENNKEGLDMLGVNFRYQDDLISFAGGTGNEIVIFNTYPNEMIIKNTNLSANHATYLDLDIKVIDNNYIFKSFDKRKEFSFPIVNYPNLHGNIPSKAAYGVFTSQLVRFVKINLNVEDFANDVKHLINKLRNQGYDTNRLMNTYVKFTRKYIATWAKFGIDISNINFLQTIF